MTPLINNDTMLLIEHRANIMISLRYNSQTLEHIDCRNGLSQRLQTVDIAFNLLTDTHENIIL